VIRGATGDDGALDAVVEALAAGLVVVVPTDTVYGLMVVASDPAATGRLFSLKERPVDVALPVLVADETQALALCAEVPAAARRLADRFWPGGLTLVLPRRGGLALDLGGHDDGTIGVRVPDHAFVVEVARRVGPLAATSANRHGMPTAATLDEVMAQLAGQDVAVAIDGGRCAGAPSSVVSCNVAGEVAILREGRVPAASIHEMSL
jgi:tRNA threonylcarbamoyl adenosine modification protein (Sua5/YciO/YrdC/YwlC family)